MTDKDQAQENLETCQTNGRTALFSRMLGHLMDPQVVVLWIIGLFLVGSIFFLGQALGPFFMAVILAYMLDGMVQRLSGKRLPRWAAVTIVYCAFLALVVGLFLWLIPLLIKQISSLISALPFIADKAQTMLLALMDKYASSLDPTYIKELVPRLVLEIESLARQLVGKTFNFLPNLFSGLLYLVLVPFLILLFLKDKVKIVAWLSVFIPTHRELFNQILLDIDAQMGRFFRGKFLEISILSILSVWAFLLFDFRFAVLLGLISGVSVIIPYVGIIIATIPIVLVALFQFGVAAAFWKLMIVYAVIQIIDANILQPYLLGSMIRIHPAAVIFALLVCGHLWGIIGVLLALPLAIVLKSILDLALPYIRQRTERLKPNETE